jgi:hypothetical protein
LRAHRVAVSLLVLLPQAALLLVCATAISSGTTSPAPCAYHIEVFCHLFVAQFHRVCPVKDGKPLLPASSCQSLPEQLCRSSAPCSLLLLCWSQNVNFQYSKNLCMSPFSDTRASQSIPVCLGDFLHSADIISSAVCSGVLPVVSNSTTFRLPKVFSES